MTKKVQKTSVRGQASSSNRRVGLLGVPLYDSEEDEDYKPPGSPTGQEKRRTSSRSHAAGRANVLGPNGDGLDVPLQQRAAEGQPQAHNAAGRNQQTPPRRTRQRVAPPPIASAPPGAGASRKSAPARAGSLAAAAGATGGDWGGLEGNLLRQVLLHATSDSALTVAAAAPCVCRHWRAVCSGLEADALAAAAAAAAASDATAAAAARAAAAAASAAAAAALLAVAGEAPGDDNLAIANAGAPTNQLSNGSSTAHGDRAAATERPGRGGDLSAAAAAAPASVGGPWACLDTRCWPRARFGDDVIRRGLDSGRWRQLRSLRLSANSPGPSAEGLVSLLTGRCGATAPRCPDGDDDSRPPGKKGRGSGGARSAAGRGAGTTAGAGAGAGGGGGHTAGHSAGAEGAGGGCGACLTSLDISECEALAKAERALRPLLAALPALALLDLSHVTAAGADALARGALGPRAPQQRRQGQGPELEQEDKEQQGGKQRQAAAGGGAGGGGGGGGPYALPCPLRVLRARGCPRLGPATLRALAPDAPHVILPPPPATDSNPSQASPPTAAHAPARAAAASTGAPGPSGLDPWVASRAVVLQPDPRVAVRVPVLVHLTELDLTGSGSLCPLVVLALEKLQAAAPNLQVLLLDAVGSAAHGGLSLAPEPRQPGPGFPRLRVCQVGLSRSTTMGLGSAPLARRRGCSMALLRRLVGGSPGLELLDVSGALSRHDEDTLRHLARQARDREGAAGDGNGSDEGEGGEDQDPGPLLDLPVPGPLACLRASRSLLASDAALRVAAGRWAGCLQELDVSDSAWVTDAGAAALTDYTALTTLDLSATAVTDAGVRRLVAALGAGPRRGGGVQGGGPQGASGAGRNGAGGGASGGGGDSAGGDGRGSAGTGAGDPGGGKEGGGRGRLRHLDISSCRGVSLAVRHAAVEGMGHLRRALGL